MQIALRLNFIENSIVEGKPLAWTVGYRAFAKLISIRSQDHHTANAEVARFLQGNQIGTIRRRAHQGCDARFTEQGPQPVAYYRNHRQRKPRFCSILRVDPSSHQRNYHRQSRAPCLFPVPSLYASCAVGTCGCGNSSVSAIPARIRIAPEAGRNPRRSPITRNEVIHAKTGSNVISSAVWVAGKID